ncbi:MAG: prephenate dehydrogenase/arogenate dehydrogenase family protein [Burkholderiales bacterium]|jgi:prephenate dehydrogenase|nr:prephenate dehydrogenase/arogenate dehydrogenase family protein [Burkholderiales bacterium]
MTEQAFVPFERLVVAGVGLMGGSLALAARQRGLAKRVVAYSRRLETANAALQMGLVDEVSSDFSQALENADALFLAAPVAQFSALLGAVDAGSYPNLLVFDAGSTKANIVEIARQLAQSRPGVSSPWFANFVPCHPIAGAEKHGPQAAVATLYEGRTLVVCPHADNDAFSVARVRQFWQAMGMRVMDMEAHEHDRLFAAVSHLPHWLAYAYVHSLLQAPTGTQDMQEGGAGFRDFSRIAGSSPEMWVDIFQDNQAQLLAHLDVFQASLNQLRDALVRSDRQKLLDELTRVSGSRKSWVGH